MKLGLVPITIKGDLFNTREITRALENTLNQTAKSIEIDFKVTVRTWANKPQFKIDKLGRFERVIGTSGLIYKFVSGGTRVRYATMTPDFQAKSRVRVIASRPGRGGLAYTNRQRPKPGIKARKFDVTIAKKWQRLIPNVFERAILTEIQKRG